MSNQIIETLGLTLLHSLWQIFFIAIILFSALKILRDFSANVRYLISVAALFLCFFLPLTTFVYLTKGSSNNFQKTERTSQPQPVEKNSPLRKQTEISSGKTEAFFESVTTKNSGSSSSLTSYLNFLVGFWLIGVFICAVRLMGGVWAVSLYKTQKTSSVEDYWQKKVEELCEHLAIRQKVRFLSSGKVEMPIVIGWLKPIVLIPASAFLQISPSELETILLHEIIHIKRHDYLINFLQNIAETLLFFHPCVWWISAKIRAEREFAVDEFISQKFENEKLIYINALAKMETVRSTAATNLVLASTGGNLMKRIENILGGSRKINSKNVSIWSGIFALTFIFGLVAGAYFIKTKEIQKSKSGREIAFLISTFRNKNNQVEYENILNLQKQYRIPATWIIDGNLIDSLKQNNSAADFFRQARETNSRFILQIPNMDSTIYLDGLNSYLPAWMERIKFVNSHLAEYGERLEFYTTYSSQIPQPMEDYLQDNQISFMPLLAKFDSRPMFDFFYDKHCFEIESMNEKKFACRDTNEQERKELREKFLQYNREILNFRASYWEEKFSEQYSQVLTFTTNELTKDSLEQVVRDLQSQYKFVPFDEKVRSEAQKMQESIQKNPDVMSQEAQISRKYLPTEYFPSNQMKESLNKGANSEKIEFKIDVKTQNFRIEGK